MKKFKGVVVLALNLSLASCGWVESEEIEAFESLCASNGGVDYLDKGVSTQYYCKNGARFSQEGVTKEMDRLSKRTEE